MKWYELYVVSKLWNSFCFSVFTCCLCDSFCLVTYFCETLLWFCEVCFFFDFMMIHDTWWYILFWDGMITYSQAGPKLLGEAPRRSLCFLGFGYCTPLLRDSLWFEPPPPCHSSPTLVQKPVLNTLFQPVSYIQAVESPEISMGIVWKKVKVIDLEDHCHGVTAIPAPPGDDGGSHISIIADVTARVGHNLVSVRTLHSCEDGLNKWIITAVSFFFFFNMVVCLFQVLFVQRVNFRSTLDDMFQLA